MHWYYVPLIAATALAAWVAWRRGFRRGLFWVAVLAAQNIITGLYLNLSGLHNAWWAIPSSFNAMTDIAVAALIFIRFRHLWEAALYAVVLTAMCVNMLYSTGLILGFPPVPPRDTYGIFLEVLSYLALALISGAALLNPAGAAPHGPPVQRRLAGWLVAGVDCARAAFFAPFHPQHPLFKKR